METRNLIAGEWTGAGEGRSFPVLNPATDEHIADVPDCGAQEAKRAVEAAAAALPAWRERPALERAAVLERFAALVLRDGDRLARLMTREQGKPLAEAHGELAYGASFLSWAAEEAKRVYGETIPATMAGKRLLALREPIGVTAAITPWNFPSAMITRKLGPALAAGCTMVVKPAEDTPLSAIALAELALEAGVPAGAFNLVTGDPEAIADVFFADPRVRMVSFTGSTEVGKLLIRHSAQNVTKLSLELGGHAPLIVFDDADMDAAIAGSMSAKIRNSGQTCVNPNRFYVHEKVYDEYVGRLTEAFEQTKVARGDEKGAQVGPLINDAAIEKVERHVADAVGRGATLRTGGKRVPVQGCADRFYAPTILEDIAPDMLVSCEETFGPVAPVMKFTDETEVIERANATPYGLSAYFFTRDLSRAWRVAEALEFGIVGVNDGTPATAQAPFGGFKQSGLGREGGHWGMEEYLEVKYVSLGL